MSKLEFYARPWVAFNPNDKQHRKWYHQFVECGGWGQCPVRFICPDDSGFDLTIMIRNQLVDYYIKKEFETKSKTVAQKANKTVDKQSKR